MTRYPSGSTSAVKYHSETCTDGVTPCHLAALRRKEWWFCTACLAMNCGSCSAGVVWGHLLATDQCTVAYCGRHPPGVDMRCNICMLAFHSTWALTVHVRHPMCVRCKELVCPCTPVLGISVKANDHPPPITSHISAVVGRSLCLVWCVTMYGS
jgi:hypothetical protein